jgi:hypothetical protein
MNGKKQPSLLDTLRKEREVELKNHLKTGLGDINALSLTNS